MSFISRGGGRYSHAAYQEEYRPPRCCGGCCEVHNGVKWLGIWIFLNTFLVLTSGVSLVWNNHWIGFYLIFFNLVYLMLCYYYVKWFQEDNIETRNDVRRGYLYVLIQSIALYAGLFILIFMIPARALPDNYTDSMGNKYEFPPNRK